MTHNIAPRLWTGLFCLAIVELGCASGAAVEPASPPQVDLAPPRRSAAAAPVAPPSAPALREPVQLAISDEILRLCGMKRSQTFFNYDSADVDGVNESVITQLAHCLTQGPLAGAQLRLIGHADPRGDEEYNLALGSRRAESVQHSLAKLGVEERRLTATSRGEFESQGFNESTWAMDRRVDVKLAN